MDKKLLVIFEYGPDRDITWDLCKDWKDFVSSNPEVERGDIMVCFWVVGEADDLDMYKERVMDKDDFLMKDLRKAFSSWQKKYDRFVKLEKEYFRLGFELGLFQDKE